VELPTLHLAQQVRGLLRLGDEVGGATHLAKGHVLLALVNGLQDVLRVDEPHHVVHVIVEHRQS
jgi:hypothetical protein